MNEKKQLPHKMNSNTMLPRQVAAKFRHDTHSSNQPIGQDSLTSRASSGLASSDQGIIPDQQPRSSQKRSRTKTNSESNNILKSDLAKSPGTSPFERLLSDDIDTVKSPRTKYSHMSHSWLQGEKKSTSSCLTGENINKNAVYLTGSARNEESPTTSRSSMVNLILEDGELVEDFHEAEVQNDKKRKPHRRSLKGKTTAVSSDEGYEKSLHSNDTPRQETAWSWNSSCSNFVQGDDDSSFISPLIKDFDQKCLSPTKEHNLKPSWMSSGISQQSYMLNDKSVLHDKTMYSHTSGADVSTSFQPQTFDLTQTVIRNMMQNIYGGAKLQTPIINPGAGISSLHNSSRYVNQVQMTQMSGAHNQLMFTHAMTGYVKPSVHLGYHQPVLQPMSSGQAQFSYPSVHRPDVSQESRCDAIQGNHYIHSGQPVFWARQPQPDWSFRPQQGQPAARMTLSSTTLQTSASCSVDRHYSSQAGAGQHHRPGASKPASRASDRLRKWDEIQPIRPGHSGLEFTVMTYNILAQEYLEENFCMYSNCRQQDLNWSHRCTALLSEIKSHSPDIVCLQEVQQNHWQEDLKGPLKKHGYENVYKRKNGSKPDGCAILYKPHKFRKIKFVPVEFKKGGRLDRDNVGIVLLLQPITPGDQPTLPNLCVATTHLLFNPKRGDVKLAQLMVLLAEIDRHAYMDHPAVISSAQRSSNVYQDPESSKGPQYCPIILCGDFNSEPHCDLYKFVTTGHLNYESCVSRLLCGQSEGGGYRDEWSPTIGKELLPSSLDISQTCQYMSVVKKRHSSQLPPEKSLVHNSGQVYHDMLFKSVYSHTISDRHGHIHNEVTSQHLRASATVDYIFYSSRSKTNQQGEDAADPLLPLARYRLLTAKNISQTGHLPNSMFPSDHLCLIAKFLLKAQ